jgi:pimeloyl-ACP methyl ester carboxylesterase
VLLVHESPMTGLMLLPLARQLAELGFTAIALDTPGYGDSDPLPGLALPTIADYADALLEAADALGLERPHLYGSHTGAMIVLEAGFRHAARLRSVVVDGLPAFTRGESVDLGRHWLVTYPPEQDGTHLLALWHRYRDHTMFFPWYRLRGDERLPIDLPSPRHLHDRLVDWLAPGTDYTPSYHAAFAYDGHLRLHELEARAAITAHFDDLLGFSMERLPERLGPSTVKARMPRAGHARWIADFLAADAAPAAPSPPAVEPIAGRITSTYADAGDVQLLVRSRVEAPGRPLALVPDPPDTGSGLVALVGNLGEQRPVLVVDLPGTGGSDPLPDEEPDTAAFAGVLAAAIRSLGFDEVDVRGVGVGAVLAGELAHAEPTLVRDVELDRPSRASPELRARIAAHPRLSLEPETDGAHLIRAWTAIRDREAFEPWFDRTRAAIRHRDMPPAEEIHRRVLEVLKAIDTWDLPERAAMGAPARSWDLARRAERA